jgi:D-3-phosphoglycerate dehydrogenase
MSPTAKLLVADELSAQGLELLRSVPGIQVDVRIGLKPDALEAIIGAYDALAVRSATQVTARILEAGTKLRVVGRAGVGVDNIDLEAANRRGIVVMNAPGAAATTVAEHTLGLLFALARQIPGASASVKSGKWEKKKFSGGREMAGKTLGVVGTGNIGAIVAQRALAMKMRVLAFDPFLSAEAASRLGVELVALEDLLANADFITLHVPLTDQTLGLIGERELSRMKRGAFLVNCSRGGVVNELALAQALGSGQLAGAALDVFEREPPPPDHPLFLQPTFIGTPHLGGSTEEAQQAISLALAEQLADFLLRGQIRNAVNVPSLSREDADRLAPYQSLARHLGSLVAQLAPAHPNEFRVTTAGEGIPEPRRLLALAALRALLQQIADVPVNDVNAPLLAKERGIAFIEERSEAPQEFTALVTVTVRGPGGQTEASGTLFGKDPRIVRVNEFEVEAVPEGPLLFLRNRDLPGVIGRVGTIIGNASLNIAHMAVSRRSGSHEAVALLGLDSPASAAVLEQLRAIEAVLDVRQIKL